MSNQLCFIDSNVWLYRLMVDPNSDEALELRIMDNYGTTNPADFFAVATETFFEKPHQLLNKHPALYNFMAQERSHAGIVLAPQQQYSVGQQLRGLLKLAADKSALEMANQLVFLPFLN